MKDNPKQNISYQPFFLYLLPLFFVEHGFIVNYDLVPVNDGLLLLGQYLATALVISLVTWRFFRSYPKSALFCAAVLGFQFFFGPAHDFLKTLLPGTFIVKYSFLVPAALIVFILAAAWLRKTKKEFLKARLYLNILLCLLILIDIVPFLLHPPRGAAAGPVTRGHFNACDSCRKPDIYLIIADGYPGRIELEDKFKFDNSAFEQSLVARKFHVIDSSVSNYNFTPFSVASLLNMNYLTSIRGSNSNKSDISVCYKTIRNNQAQVFFSGLGYRFYNYSIFDFNKQISRAKPTFLLRKTRPILAQTFLYRLRRDLSYHLVTTLKLGSVIKSWRLVDLRNNNKLFELTRQTAAGNPGTPKFVYTHLVMPHYPYYFDSSGHEIHYSMLTDEYAFNEPAFIQYLQYSNRKLLELVDDIFRSSPHPPIIILMGDHGFREFRNPVEEKYHFMNLNAVYFPDGDYSGFYKGQSNVNQFRIILNSHFGQNLPLLKDSSSFLQQ